MKVKNNSLNDFWFYGQVLVSPAQLCLEKDVTKSKKLFNFINFIQKQPKPDP